jgi:hypothetical protein
VLGFSTVLTHRIATHLDAVGVVDQPVEVAVRQRRITDLFVPVGQFPEIYFASAYRNPGESKDLLGK